MQGRIMNSKYLLLFSLVIIFITGCATSGSITPAPAPAPVSVIPSPQLEPALEKIQCWDQTMVYDSNYCPRQSDDPRGLRDSKLSWENYSISNPLPLFEPTESGSSKPIKREYFTEGENKQSLYEILNKIDSVLECKKYNFKVYRYLDGIAVLTDNELIDKYGKVLSLIHI